MTNDDNKWVFLSHSNKDFAKVSLVRNQLELKDLRPIMLYLKCFEGEPDDVVLDLLKKEIDARPRFVLCKSSNSIHSYYVQQEISYIKSLNRPYEIVDLNDDNDIIEKINRLYRRTNILIFSSKVIDSKLSSILTEIGYFTNTIDDNTAVYNYHGRMSPEQYEQMANNKCQHALNNGYCLLLFNFENDSCSPHFSRIIKFSQEKTKHYDYLIPVKMNQLSNVPDKLKTHPNFLDVSDIKDESQIEKIVNHIKAIDLSNNL